MALTLRDIIRIPKAESIFETDITEFNAPKHVYIPVCDNKEEIFKLFIKNGDRVDKGQRIAVAEKQTVCSVHASISGVVRAIEEKNGITYIVIENDFKDRLSSEIRPYEGSFDEIEFDTVLNKAADIGIDICQKLISCKEKVNTLILDCTETEPYVITRQGLIFYDPEAVIGGMKLLLKAIGIRQGDIAIDYKNREAVKLLRGMVRSGGFAQVNVIKAKYPRCDEKRIVYSITDKQVPLDGSSIDVGCVVFSAEEAAALYNGFVYGMPYIKRIVSVGGDCLENPCLALVPVGTATDELIEYCGGINNEVELLINGGPMTGREADDPTSPITKATTAVLAFSAEIASEDELSSDCIRCGRCVNDCPMLLMPNYIAQYSKQGKYSLCEKYDVMSCIECGQCSYICPAKLPLTSLIREAKTKTATKKGEKK